MLIFQNSLDANKQIINAAANIYDNSDTIYALVLASGTAKSVTVPVGATKCIIRTTGTSTYMKINGTATTPAADNLTGSASELIGQTLGRNLVVSAGSTISVINSAAAVVTFSFYS
jgi:hypothetical protein